MKKLIVQLFGKSRLVKGVFSLFRGSLSHPKFIRTTRAREIFKTLAVAVGSGVLTKWVCETLLEDNEKEYRVNAQGESTSKGEIDYALTNRQSFREFERRMGMLLSVDLQESDAKEYVELIRRFVQLVSMQNDPRMAAIGLTALDIYSDLAQIGTDTQEDGNSATVYRYIINRSENSLDQASASHYLMNMLDIAMSGAPLK